MHAAQVAPSLNAYAAMIAGAADVPPATVIGAPQALTESANAQACGDPPSAVALDATPAAAPSQHPVRDRGKD